MTARRIGFWLGLAGFVITFLVPAPASLAPMGWHTAGLVWWMAAWWMTEALPLYATAFLPFIVLPIPSARWDYRDAALRLGSVGAVILGDEVVYGVVGDLGPAAILGEASYRMAELLGVDPDPSTGGTDDEVTYVIFGGKGAQVDVMEDHAEATAIGEARAAALIAGA